MGLMKTRDYIDIHILILFLLKTNNVAFMIILTPEINEIKNSRRNEQNARKREQNARKREQNAIKREQNARKKAQYFKKKEQISRKGIKLQIGSSHKSDGLPS